MNNRAYYFLRKNKLRLMMNTLRQWWMSLLGILITGVLTVNQVIQSFDSVEQFLVFCSKNRMYVYGIVACFCFIRIYCIKNPVFKLNAATLLYFYNTDHLTKLLERKKCISFLLHASLSFGVALCVHEFSFHRFLALDALKLLFFLRSSWLIAWIYYQKVGMERIISGLVFPIMLPLLFFENLFPLIVCGLAYIAVLFYAGKYLTLNFPKYFSRMCYIDQVEAAQSQNNLIEMARIAEENRPANVSGVKLQHFPLSKRTALFAESVLDVIRTQNQIWIVVITFPLVGWLLVNTSVLDSMSFSIDPLMVSILATILTMVAFTSVFQVISEKILKMVRKKTVGLELPYTDAHIFWAYFLIATIMNLILTIVLDLIYVSFSLGSLGLFLVANAAYLLMSYSTIYSPKFGGILSAVSGMGLFTCILFHCMV